MKTLLQRLLLAVLMLVVFAATVAVTVSLLRASPFAGVRDIFNEEGER